MKAAGLRDVFDAKYYADQYPDLKAAFGYDEEALFQHFVNNGLKEGRNMSPILNVRAYRESYQDLDKAFGDNWDAYVEHYFTFGVNERRKEGILFDPLEYADSYGDIKAAFGNDINAIVRHYLEHGIEENRTEGTAGFYKDLAVKQETEERIAREEEEREAASDQSESDAASQDPEESVPESEAFHFNNSFDKLTIHLPGNNPNEYGSGNPAFDRLVDDINKRILGEGSANKLAFSFTAESGENGYYNVVNQNLSDPAQLADVTRYSGKPSSNEAFVSAAQAGAFWDLAPYIELKNPDGSYVYPNLAAWKECHKLALNYYGKIYGLPLSRTNTAREGWGYRLDWAEKFNIDVTPGEPVTLEVFEEMLDKFTNNDPDGNGVDDTVGLFLDGWTGALDIMQLWFGVPNGWGVAKDDAYAKYNIKKGDIVPAQLTSEYLTALKKFREWYQAGYINQDFYEISGGQAISSADVGLRAEQGGIGVQVLDALRKIELYLENQGFVETNAPLVQALFTLSGYVDTGLGGYCRPQNNSMNGFIAISKVGSINTEEKLKDALYVIDQLSEGWYYDLFTWGWVGEETKENQQATYYLDADGYANKFDGNPEGELTAAQAWGQEYDTKYANGFNQVITFNYAKGHEPVVPTAPHANPTIRLEQQLYAEDFNYLVLDASTGCVSSTYTADGTSLNTLIEEARKSFITDSSYTETNLEAAIQQWLDAGMQQVINEMNAQYHAMH